MLCHLVTRANKSLYAKELDDMFRIRHEVFVERMGWRELRQENKRDIDQYDTDDTVYLIVIDDDGEVSASTRFNPTWKRHQLEPNSSMTKKFADKEPPRGPEIWEGSRLVPGLRDRHGKAYAMASMGTLFAGISEFCMSRGITRCISVFEMPALSMLMSTGMQTEPLGLPQKYETDHGEGEAMAVEYPIGRVEGLLRTRQGFGLRGPVLVEAPACVAPDDCLSTQLIAKVAQLHTPAAQAEALNALSSIQDADVAPEPVKERLAS